jgi:hypothetical protein
MENQIKEQKKWDIDYYMSNFKNNPSVEEIQEVTNRIQKFLELSINNPSGMDTLSELQIEVVISNCIPLKIHESGIREFLNVENIPSTSIRIYNDAQEIRISDKKYFMDEEE